MNQDNFKKFSWIQPWGQKWYKNVVIFQIRTALYTLYKQIQNINIVINILKSY